MASIKVELLCEAALYYYCICTKHWVPLEINVYTRCHIRTNSVNHMKWNHVATWMRISQYFTYTYSTAQYQLRIRVMTAWENIQISWETTHMSHWVMDTSARLIIQVKQFVMYCIHSPGFFSQTSPQFCYGTIAQQRETGWLQQGWHVATTQIKTWHKISYLIIACMST